MPVRFEWDNAEKTIIREIFEGKWDLTDLMRMFDESGVEIGKVDHRVDVIMDFRESTKILPGNLLSSMRSIDRRAPTNMGISVVVGASNYIKSLIDVMRRLMPKPLARVRVVETLEQAYAAIQQERQSLT